MSSSGDGQDRYEGDGQTVAALDDRARAADARIPQAAAGDEKPPPRRTLPPPEWSPPRSVAGLALDWLVEQAPVARKKGPRAAIASLRARQRAAERAGDPDAERVHAAALARALSAHGTELDLATKLARRALVLGDDAELREELSAWFSALGEPGLAGATLTPLVETETGEQQARTLIRVAVFAGRSGNAARAADALSAAAQANPADPVPEELLGAIGTWSKEAVPAGDAALSYLEAAQRRELLGDSAGAFEDLLRAFDLAPDVRAVAERLAANLSARGRLGAADEVLREHAQRAPTEALSVHRARLRDAIVDGDAVRALGAAFDAGLDRVLDPHAVAGGAADEESDADIVTFERLLSDAGLHEMAGARLELAAEALAGSERSRVRVVLGKMLLGHIGNQERALSAWVDAVVSDPSNETALALLREFAASSGEYVPLVEALVRVGLSSDEDQPGRDGCLRELMTLADQRLGDPALSLWALARISNQSRDEELAVIASRLAPRARLQDESLAETRARVSESHGEDRIDLLRLLAAALRGRPDEAEEYAKVLSELVQVTPEERAFRVALERVLQRLGRDQELEALLQSDLGARLQKAQEERARLGIATIQRNRGDATGALGILEPLAEESTAFRASWAMIFAAATRARREELRAVALRKLASLSEPRVGALLACVASDIFLALGDRDQARAAAEQACHADSSSPRSIASLARSLLERRDRVAAVALERAAAVALPRAALCRALADTFDALGELDNALAWTQRWLALRPGDRDAARALIERVTAKGDPTRIADALGWLLAQPEPLGEMAPEVSRAVRRLADGSAARGAALARRAIDVFGPRVTEIRDVVLAVADFLGERSLAIAVLERELASGASNRPGLLLELARRRRDARDADGAARSLVRALAEGADPTVVLSEMNAALPPDSSDGEISLLQARAEALGAMPSADPEGTVRAFREYGAALWDLADDREAAVSAWERACALDPDRGVERLARDLVAFAGHAEASRELEALAETRSVPADKARLFASAAGVALDGQLRGPALSAALRALEADPSRADVLGIAESAAGTENIEDLERAYDIAARGALGIYGDRAAHYRAARHLERIGMRARALRHAVAAFEAVPGEGVTFVLMMRLAERVGDSTEAVQTIERVASRAKSPEERAAWLRRAALVAGSGEEGKRQRVEVLLRAVDANPQSETFRSLGAAIADLVATLPEEKDIAELRFERALRAVLPRLEGPDGARVAVEAARIATVVFGLPDTAFGALERAARSDASIDEYSILAPLAPELAESSVRAAEFVALVTDVLTAPYSNIGTPLIELGLSIGEALGGDSAAVLAVRAAERAPDDADLLRRAEAAARASGNRALLDAVLAVVPVEHRIQGLLDRAAREAAGGDPESAIRALEDIRSMPEASDEARSEATSRLRYLYRAAGRLDALEEALREDLVGVEDPASKMSIAMDLGALLSEQGLFEEAVRVIDAALSLSPSDRELLEQLGAYAGRARLLDREAEAIGRLLEIEDDAAGRLGLLRRLAPLLEEQGDRVGALARHREVLSLDPGDSPAFAALERDAAVRSDWETLADLLRRRAGAARTADDATEARLRRAEVLETRLGRPNDARDELEALLGEVGDSQPVLVRLADLNGRLGMPLRAAQLWQRASTIADNPSAIGDLSRRACRAYLDGGDVESARRILASIFEHPKSPELVELRVDIARRTEDPLELSEALEESALTSTADAGAKCTLLLEAARASLSAGHQGRALEQARRAAELVPESAEAQLLARYLEYRARGAGSREEALSTVKELRAIRGTIDDSQRELQAFLLAEALDVADGQGAGIDELRRVHAEIGPLPLVALGIAERLSRTGAEEQSLALFEVALEGELRDLRRRGEVALAAASAAVSGGQPERALGYLEVAAADPETHARALLARAELRVSSEPAQPELPPSSERPTVLMPKEMQDAVLGAENASPPKAVDDEPVLELRSRRTQVIGTPEPEKVIDLAGTNEATPQPRPGSLRAIAPPKPVGRPAEPETVIELVKPTDRVTLPFALELRSKAPPKPASRTPAQPAATVSEPPESPRLGTPAGVVSWPRRSDDREDELLAALARGSIEAGRELARKLEGHPDRAEDLVGVCRRVAYLSPGDRSLLEKLYEATLAARNVVYGRALEHALRAFDPMATPLDPPPLWEQQEQPERLQALLFRDAAVPAVAALGMVWNGAQHLFRKDLAAYGLTGVERVSPTAPTPVSQIYGAAIRMLGMTRVALFHDRTGDAVTLDVALLSPPALVLRGDVREATPTFAYHLGSMLAATLPEHALLYGAPEQQVTDVLRALLVAFGPPMRGSGLGTVAGLAEMLWESVPARSQRRLRELCEDTDQINFEAAATAVGRAACRAGLFVCGDLTTSVREACADLGISSRGMETPGGLAALCSSSPAIADLVRLATSPEYANARFRRATAEGGPPAGTWGTV